MKIFLLLLLTSCSPIINTTVPKIPAIPTTDNDSFICMHKDLPIVRITGVSEPKKVTVQILNMPEREIQCYLIPLP
jgi:hypothetical protein